MLADIGVEFIKAPLGDFIAGNTQFKRAGAKIRDDFFGGLVSLVQSWSIGSDAFVGRAETMQIGSGTFKTITLAKLGITNATFDKLEAPVGTITHAEGQLEASQKLATGLGQQAGESVRQWWSRVQDKLPEEVKKGAAQYFKQGFRGTAVDEKGLGTYLATATVGQVADLNTAVRTEYVDALTGLLKDHGYTTGEIAGLTTEQMANIGNMAATDTAGKFGFAEDFLLDTYMGKLGKKIEAQPKTKAGKPAKAGATAPDYMQQRQGTYGASVEQLGTLEKRNEAAIISFYKSVPQNVQDALNAFINTSKTAIDPSVQADLTKKFGSDWMTAFKDGTGAITNKPVDKKIVSEMVRVFGPKWRERLQGFGSLLFEREGGADADALRKSLADAISTEIGKLTPEAFGNKPGKPGAKDTAKDRAAAQKYMTSAIGQAALANASSPDVETAKKGMADLGAGLTKAIPDATARMRLIDAMVAIQKAATIPNLDVVTNLLNNIPSADRGIHLVGDAIGWLGDKAAEFLAKVNGGGAPKPATGEKDDGRPTYGASGLVGDANRLTHLVVGEAGREHVAIIRNFKRLTLPQMASALTPGSGRGGVHVSADKLQLFSDGDKRSLDAQLGFLSQGGR
jgi:hypothetical protein